MARDAESEAGGGEGGKPALRLFGRTMPLPRNRLLRIGLGLLLILGGLLGFLPVLGFWMIPLGLAVLAVDFAIAERWRRKAEAAVARAGKAGNGAKRVAAEKTGAAGGSARSATAETVAAARRAGDAAPARDRRREGAAAASGPERGAHGRPERSGGHG